MSAAAADIFAEEIKANPGIILGLATGSSPIGLYEKLAEKNRAGEITFKNVRSFNLDEYYPISPENPQSYAYFMRTNLFDKVDIDMANTNIPAGDAEDADAECAAYDAKMKAAGGTDIQLLGIGPNGHIGFNEPAEELVGATHVTDLTEETLEANARFFGKDEVMPKRALTMGMDGIMSSKKIVLLITGKKREVYEKLKTGEITPLCPATLLHEHPDCITIVDMESVGVTE